jgi:hypothetical protein
MEARIAFANAAQRSPISPGRLKHSAKNSRSLSRPFLTSAFQMDEPLSSFWYFSCPIRAHLKPCSLTVSSCSCSTHTGGNADTWLSSSSCLLGLPLQSDRSLHSNLAKLLEAVALAAAAAPLPLVGRPIHEQAEDRPGLFVPRPVSLLPGPFPKPRGRRDIKEPKMSCLRLS